MDSSLYIENRIFRGNNFSREMLAKGDYENCTFENCGFSDSDISDVVFIDCKFKNCDFTMVNASNTNFRDVKFKGCKMLGLHFENCNKFGLAAEFEGCILNLSSFYKLNIKFTKFIDCIIQEADFTGANLTGCLFEKCNLAGTVFSNSNLEKADFRTSFNFLIDPEVNRIRKAKFSIRTISGLLDKYDIEIEN